MFANWDLTLPFIQIISSGISPTSFATVEEYHAALAVAVSFDIGFSLVVLFGLGAVMMSWIFRVVSRS